MAPVQLGNLDRIVVLRALRKNLGLEEQEDSRYVDNLWYGCDRHIHPHEGPCMQIAYLGGLELGHDVMESDPYDKLAQGKKTAAEVIEELRQDKRNFYSGPLTLGVNASDPKVIRQIINANRADDDPLKETVAGDPLWLKCVQIALLPITLPVVYGLLAYNTLAMVIGFKPIRNVK